MYPYGQGGQRINSIAAQYVPYQNLIRSPINISPNRAPIHYNNPVYYSNPYSRLYWFWFLPDII